MASRATLSGSLFLAGIGCFAASIHFLPGLGLSPAFGLSFGALASALGLACFAFAAAVSTPPSVTSALGLERSQLSPWQTTGLVLGILGLSHLLDAGLEWAGMRSDSVLADVDWILADAGADEIVVAFICIAIAAGIAEELLFRGWLLRAIRARIGTIGAVVATAVTFGLVHGDLAQGSAAAALGLYLGAVAVATGSTWVAIACHVSNNAVAVLAGFAAIELPQVWLVTAACSVALALGIGVLLRLASSSPASGVFLEPPLSRGSPGSDPNPSGNALDREVGSGDP